MLFAVILPLLLPCSLGAAIDASPGRKPKIAVIIDDFGLTYPGNPPDEEWFRLPWPLTVAVMPRSPRTKAAAEAAQRAGKEVIIHFPLDPFLKLQLPEDDVDPADASAISALLKESLAAIPQAKGLNLHRSFKAVHNRPIMRWFMRALKSHEVYFIDSRISASKLAYVEARSAGLETATNRTFLDQPGHTLSVDNTYR